MNGKRFAEYTTVEPSSTLAAIETLLTRYGYPPNSYVFKYSDAQSGWVLRIVANEFTFRFVARATLNPKSHESAANQRKRALRRLLRVALLVVKGKFEEMAGISELGVSETIAAELVKDHLPANIEVEDGRTLAELNRETQGENKKWQTQLKTTLSTKNNVGIVPR